LYEPLQTGELRAGALDRSPFGLVVLHALDAREQGCPGREARTRLLQRLLVALEIRPADGLELVEWGRHPFGVAQHARELLRPQREARGGVRPLALEPRGQLAHRDGRGRIGPAELRLERRVLHPGEDRRDVLLVEVREAAKRRDAAIEQGTGERAPEIRANLARRPRHGRGVPRVRAQARLERRVVPREIRTRIEVVTHPAQVEGRIDERRFGRLVPEQIVIHPRDEVVALEPLGLAHRSGVDRERPRARVTKPRDLRRNPLRAPVGQLPVVLVTSGHDREARVSLQVFLDERIAHRRPGAALGRRAAGRRAARAGREHHGRGQGRGGRPRG